MNALLRRVYALLLRLYPAGFRQVFGEEMQAVFDDALQDQAYSRLRILLREAAALPAGLMAAWGWSLRHKESFAPRFSLAADGLPAGASLPVRPAPTPWLESLLAGLPFLLLGLASGLPGLLNWPETAPIFRVTLLFPMVTAGAASLIWSLLRGWPRWAAGWYLIWLTLLFYPLSVLFPVGGNTYQFLLTTVYPLVIAWLLYRLARRDRIAAVLAGLPAMLVVWVPFMEQTPMTIIPAPLRGATFMSLFLLSGLGAVIFLRASRPGLALALAFCASALGGALAAYAGIYFGGMLNFSEPGPSPRAALEIFLPAFILSAAVAVGPLLARALRDLGLRAGRWGRVSYRLALLGLLLMLVLAVLKTAEMTGGTILPRVIIGSPEWLPWAVCGGVYLAGFGWLAFAAERRGVLPKAGILALLFALPLGVPAAIVTGPPAYMGWLYPLHWAVNGAQIAWLAASVWLVLHLPDQG